MLDYSRNFVAMLSKNSIFFVSFIFYGMYIKKNMLFCVSPIITKKLTVQPVLNFFFFESFVMFFNFFFLYRNVMNFTHLFILFGWAIFFSLILYTYDFLLFQSDNCFYAYFFYFFFSSILPNVTTFLIRILQ